MLTSQFLHAHTPGQHNNQTSPSSAWFLQYDSDTHKDVPNHPGSFTDILLYQLTPDHPDKCRICPVCYSPRTERLSRPWGSEKEHSLGRVDPEGDELFGLKQGGLDDLFDLFDLFFASTDLVVAVKVAKGGFNGMSLVVSLQYGSPCEPHVTSGFSSTSINETVASILGGSGIQIL